MVERTFMKTVSITTPYITLGQFLKFCGLIGNGSEARFFLEENSCLVNGEEEKRRGKKLYPKDIVTINGEEYKVEG